MCRSHLTWQAILPTFKNCDDGGVSFANDGLSIWVNASNGTKGCHKNVIPQVCNVLYHWNSLSVHRSYHSDKLNLGGDYQVTFCTSCASLVFLLAATFGNGSAVRFKLSSDEAWEWTEKFCMFCWKGTKRIQPEQGAFQNQQRHVRKFTCSPLRDGILSDS